MTTAPICPRCSQVDQVRSVQTIYAAQTGVTRSAGTAVGGIIGGNPVIMPVIMNTSSYGTDASSLALQLAPPPHPRRISVMNCGVIAAFILPVGMVLLGWGLTVRPPGPSTGDRVSGPIFLILGLALALGLFLIFFFESRKFERRYRAHVAVWPALVHVWQNAMICLRCYGAFFPAGALPTGPSPDEFIPIGFFQAAVTDIGNRLARAGSAT